MSDLTEFTVTADHLALLQAQRLVVPGDPDGPVVPLDPLRPYGTDNVQSDVAAILGLTYDPDAGGLAPADAELVAELHAETAVALEVFVDAGSIELGTYERGTPDDPWVSTTS